MHACMRRARAPSRGGVSASPRAASPCPNRPCHGMRRAAHRFAVSAAVHTSQCERGCFPPPQTATPGPGPGGRAGGACLGCVCARACAGMESGANVGSCGREWHVHEERPRVELRTVVGFDGCARRCAASRDRFPCHAVQCSAVQCNAMQSRVEICIIVYLIYYVVEEAKEVRVLWAL